MRSRTIRRVTLAALVLAPVATGAAQTFTFTGSRSASGIPPAAPDIGRCGAPPALLISGIFGTGTSNLGAFTTVESNCINPQTGSLFNGRFTFTFADGSSITGTGTGTVVLPPVNGVAPNAFVYLVTGGTGLYAGVVGRIDAVGQVRFAPDGTTSNSFTYTGSFGVVPEPASGVLLATGLAALGVGMRRRADRRTMRR